MTLANVLLRPTFIVADLDKAVRFYCDVFDWSIVFDQIIKVDHRFPPAAGKSSDLNPVKSSSCAPCRYSIRTEFTLKSI